MKRKCTLFAASKDGKRAIYFDEESKNDIKAFITQSSRYKDKFRFISEIILNGLRNPEIYDKEEINSKCKGVTAMKFFKGQENYRIYCKEESTPNGIRVVIAAIIHQKKAQKISNKEKAIIEKVGGFTYEFK